MSVDARYGSVAIGMEDRIVKIEEAAQLFGMEVQTLRNNVGIKEQRINAIRRPVRSVEWWASELEALQTEMRNEDALQRATQQIGGLVGSRPNAVAQFRKWQQGG